MKNPNEYNFEDDIRADDLFIEADLLDDCPEFASMDAMAPGVIEDINPYDEDDFEDDSWSDADSLASAGWGTDEDYGDCPW